MIVGRFIYDAHIRQTLVYAVTDQRILTVRGTKMTSLDLHRLPRLELSEHKDGTGTLSFETSSMLEFGKMNGFGAWVPALGSASQFFRIQNPSYVYGIIREQGRSCHRNPHS
jgi:hypothetical protein